MPPIDPQNYFLQQGILGVIIVVLAAVIIWQQKKMDDERKQNAVDLKALYDSVNKVQDLRIQDNKDTILNAIKANAETTFALTAVKDAISGATRVLESMRK